jgi:dihydroflavonol-4-reductase
MAQNLVIGGAGFIGSNLVHHLLDTGDSVSVLHRPGANLKNLQGLQFKSFPCDLEDLEALRPTLTAAMEGCQNVYNLAACGTSLKKDQKKRQTINIDAVRIIAQVAHAQNVECLVHVSSSAAVGFPLQDGVIADEEFPFNAHENHYAMTKWLGEKEVAKEVKLGLRAVVAAPCSTIGARGTKSQQLDTIRNIAAGKGVIYPPGGLCLTRVMDLVCGMVLCCEKGVSGQRYILGGHNITYKQYFDSIAHETNGRSPFITFPRFIMPWLGWGVEMISNLLKRDNVIDRHVGLMISHDLYYSSERAVRELGYTMTPLETTIRETADEMRKMGSL